MNISNDRAVPVREPGYLALLRRGELAERVAMAKDRLGSCDLCPFQCGANRLDGRTGRCGAGARVRLGSWNTHRWEEPPISGEKGSGTIFFSYCTGSCLFCQNYPISQMGAGEYYDVSALAKIMLDLQARGCHNINLVTPTHYVPQILEAVEIAAGQGLSVPLLYNTSGYERLETLSLLDGVIDIYLPDSKYASDDVARRLSGFKEYTRHNHDALLEMARQVGTRLICDEHRVARRGMVVRHLVLPNGLSQTSEVLQWLAENLTTDVYVSLMAQYFPAYKAVDHRELGRRLSHAEYKEAVGALDAFGLENGWQQELDTDY